VALLFLQHGLTKLFGFPGSLALLFGFYTRAAAFIMAGEMAARISCRTCRALLPIITTAVRWLF
jgi:uncharacterized membrane protein YphA (DoxX/SURF4 family)